MFFRFKGKVGWFDRVLLFTDFIIGKVLLNFRRYRWRPYDPEWLVQLAREQYPENPELHKAFSNCHQASGDIPYIHFVNPRNPNKPGSDWQFLKNETLEDPKYGEIIVDILKDGRIGGIEFLDVLLGTADPST